MRDRIRLKNANDLLIESGLDTIFAEGPQSAERLARFQSWRDKNVSFLLLLADEDRHEVLQFTEAARDAGFVVRTILPEANFAALEPLRTDILREIRRANGVLLGNGSRPLSLETFLALLLMTLKKKSVSPEQAVTFATGRDEYKAEDRIVYEYKQYLDPAYALPAFVAATASAEPAAAEPAAAETVPAVQPVAALTPESRPSAELIVESQSSWEDQTAGETAPPEASLAEQAPADPPAAEQAKGESFIEFDSESQPAIKAAAPLPAEPIESPVTQAESPPAQTQEPAPEQEEQAGQAEQKETIIEEKKEESNTSDRSADESEQNETATATPLSASVPPTPEPAPAPAPVPVAASNAVATRTPAAAQPVPTAADANSAQFQASRFTILVKLISITSGIIIVALGIMIFAASFFFRRAMVTGVQENNLNQATVIGSRVETELRSLETGARLLVTGGGGGALREEFFRSNPGILFVGTAAPAENGINIRRSIYNRALMDGNDIKEGDIARLHGLNSKYFLKSFNGATVFQNISPGFVIPVLGMSMVRTPGEEIILVYLDAENFLKVFNAGGGEEPEEKITSTFMVNSVGEVIAHPEPEKVLSRSNMADLEIVDALLKSAVEEGQKAYEDEAGTNYLGSYKKIDFAGLGVVSTAEEERVLEPVYWIQTNNILITMIVLVLSILIVYYVAKSLSVPIVRLVGATRAVEQGDYSVNIEPASGDEVGVLTDSFVRMAQGLGEREKLKDAMVKFVNKQVADLAMKGQIALGGEQKDDVAVFFSDLRGFTAMSEKMTAEEVVTYLNEYFTGMVSCVNETHGIVDKFIGDAVMAHWGAFESHGNDTENAIMGALGMRAAIIAFNERGGGDRPFAKQGCGINTGQVVSGQIGSEERFEFTVIGDTVNLASRIEALNKPFGTDILISADSYELVKDIFKFEPMPAIKVKGKTEPQVIYAVVGRLDDPNCPKDMDEVRKMLGIEFDTSKEIDPDAKEEKFEVVGG